VSTAMLQKLEPSQEANGQPGLLVSKEELQDLGQYPPHGVVCDESRMLRRCEL
jgi:hypothetical protein